MSRLLDSGENERIRNFLESRNLYTPNDPYNINSSQVVNTINTIANLILPFKSIDIRNTVVGRALGLATGEGTPLAQIGARMLGDQLVKTAASGALAAYFPSTTIDPFNRIIEPFKRKIDFEITDRGDQTRFGKFFQNITRSYRAINPFTKDVTAEGYIRETGKGQIQGLVLNLNHNWFITSNEGYLDALDEKGFAIDSFSTLNSNRIYFTENRSLIEDPYNFFRDSWSSNIEIKANQLISRQDESDKSYLKSISDITSWYGRTTYLDTRYSLNEYNTLGLKNDIYYQIVWGRDGTKSEVDGIVRKSFERNAALRGDSETELELTPKTMTQYNARRGLLQYTSELLNASEGKFVDQTRKIFKSGKDGSIVGKQGSGLFEPPNNKYTQAMESVNGIRQHTVIDQYNRFAKTIRFDGNYVYNGHENSVIYNSVMPNIAPLTKDLKDEFSPENNQNKNLMFSIENLAFELDNDNTLKADIYDRPMQFPSCQKGGNGGRVMWFAPYDVDVTEQAVARYTDTQFIGRGEPIYTYSNSERILTLNFKLLMDHPPQSKNRKTDREVREFFQFGGDKDEGEEEFKNLPQLKKRSIILTSEINALENKFQINPIPVLPSVFDFYFPNDVPFIIGFTAIENIISSGYELSDSDEGRYPTNYGQNNPFDNNLSDLIDNFLNEKSGNLYIVNIIGWTSELFTSEYNEDLGLRRARSLQEHIENKIFDRWNLTAEELGIKFITSSQGEVDDPSTESADSINTIESVLARRASILITLDTVNETEVSDQMSPDEKQTVEEKKEEKMEVDTQIKRATGYDIRKSTTCGFNRYQKTTKQQVGYDSFIGEGGQQNLFQPIFYSQTPKDFHDRLTFLHQCTRQGPPLRRFETKKGADGGVSEVSVSSKNSVFGRQPICVLRLGDQWNTKVIIENIQFTFSNSPWDTNPEGYGMQFMSADISMQMKVIGGESLAGPISVLQNAVTFNYYANSTYAKDANYEGDAAYQFEVLQYGNPTEQERLQNKIDKANESEELRIANQDKQ